MTTGDDGMTKGDGVKEARWGDERLKMNINSPSDDCKLWIIALQPPMEA